MSIEYLKKAQKTSATGETDTREIVERMLAEIEQGGEARALLYARDLDDWQGEVVMTREKKDAAIAQLTEQNKADITFSWQRVKAFAEAQLASLVNFETELSPGLIAGQKQIPVNTAGCYVPGGRYAHIASAIMTVTTARVAGVKNVIVS